MINNDVVKKIASKTDTIILKFSTGKDSLAAWLFLKPYFAKIIPVYHYIVPELDFVNEALDYYEGIFKTKIYRIPHRYWYDHLSFAAYQTLERHELLKWWNLERPTLQLQTEYLAHDIGIGADCWKALGVRRADSFMRRKVIEKTQGIDEKNHIFYPLAYATKSEVMLLIQEAGIFLTRDYLIFNRSWDGLDARYIAPLKAYYPNDWIRLKKLFPFIEATLIRQKVKDGIKARRADIQSAVNAGNMPTTDGAT